MAKNYLPSCVGLGFPGPNMFHNPSTLWAAAILLSLAHDGLPEHNYQQTQANHNEHDVMV
jgi:hypothetical protein